MRGHSTLRATAVRVRAWSVAVAGIAAGALGVSACAAVAAGPADDVYAQRLTTLINQHRVRHARGPLAVDAGLQRLAQEHSAAMATAGRLSHDGFPTRAQRSGHALCVENVGWNYATPQAQFDGWRDSAGHDRNMLDSRVGHVGVATVNHYTTMIACGR